MVANAIGRARVAQIDRVNGKADAQASVDDWLQRVAPERAESARDAEIARLRARVEQLEAQLAELALPGGLALGQRPVITAMQAVRRTGLSLPTVNRYCNDGHWDAELLEDGIWLIFADQPLAPKERKKGR